MKNKFNQMFKDKLFLVMLVLGLLTIVAAAGVVTIQRGNGQQENPYLDMQGQEELLAEDPVETEPVAGESNALAEDAGPNKQANEEIIVAQREENLNEQENPDTVVTENAYPAEEAASGMEAATALVLDFNDTSKMLWPGQGNIVLDYSMDSTIYFPTLDQYKCNPGLVIQGEVSDPVYAPANARVLETGVNEEIGNYLVLDFGNSYTAICGQLKEIPVCEGEYLEKGQLLGYVAEPTKYYTVEGSNIFLELKHEDKTVDPLDYLE